MVALRSIRKIGYTLAVGAGAGLLSLTGCGVDFDDHLSLVSEPRVLAIRSEPAEAKPGTQVRYQALVARGGADGVLPDMGWAFCNERKPLAELGPVNLLCLEREGENLVQIGEGSTAQGTLPRQGCRNFGPSAPPASGGEPAGRPVDPDASGGYHQPVRIFVEGPEPAVTLGQTRIVCGLAGATPEQLGEFNRRYTANQNPELQGLSVVRGGEERAFVPGPEFDPANVVRAGERLRLRASWASCAEAPCTGAEPYVVYEVGARTVVDRRESIRVSWYATGGDFAQSGTGREASDFDSTTDNIWTAPTQPGPVRLWTVIRDDRGGVGWQEFLLEVE